jgi:hypothetical protein
MRVDHREFSLRWPGRKGFALAVAVFVGILGGAMLAYDSVGPAKVLQTGDRSVRCLGLQPVALPWRLVDKPQASRSTEQLNVAGRWQDCDPGSCRKLEELYCSLSKK